jgi:magnesium chelatase family protein
VDGSRQRPFYDLHHSPISARPSAAADCAKPGETSLAHLGVLFLDELPEFHGIR